MLIDPITESDNPTTALRITDVFMISLTFWCEIRIRDRFQKGKLEDYFTNNVVATTKSE